MGEELIIVGNGLGKAIDYDFFDLKRALRQAWDDGPLTDQEKNNIRLCLLKDDQVIDDECDTPVGEEQLGLLQEIVNACDTIAKVQISSDKTGWLSQEGLKFPEAIRKYLHAVANQFYDPNQKIKLDDNFSKNLSQYVMKNHPHIVTLNYDDLLYDCFQSNGVFSKPHYHLRDGFFYKSLDIVRAKKHICSTSKWYLHLHGTPLFCGGIDGSVEKLGRDERTRNVGIDSPHIVLSHHKYKESIIGNSDVLSNYWEILRTDILPKINKITIIGVGGYDHHLNRLLGNEIASDVEVHIVHRSTSQRDQAEVKSFWSNQLKSELKNTNINVHIVDSIFKYEFDH